MTPTEREWGALEREVREVRHDHRNLKMVVNENISNISDLQQSLSRLKTQIATGIAAVVIVSAVVAWIVEMVWN